MAPDQAPDAVQDVASVEDQVSVEEPPLETELGFAESVTVGTGVVPVMLTWAEPLPVPPAPVQLRLNVLAVVKAPVDWVPETALVPDQAPDAVQDVALVEDQVSVEEPPLATEVGFAETDTVGAGVVPATVTCAEALAVPPGPVQLRLNVLVLVKAPVDWVPETALAPDQTPDAVQDVALVDDQVRVEDPPLATEVGFAASDTVGAGVGGGVPATLTWAEALALPFGPVQVSEKLLLVVSGPIDWLPEAAMLPDHAPVAEHEPTSAELHVSIETPPLATDGGFAEMDTVGPGPNGRTLSLSLPPPPPPQAVSTSAAKSSRPLASKPLVLKIALHSLTAAAGVAPTACLALVETASRWTDGGDTVATEAVSNAGGGQTQEYHYGSR